MEWTPNGAIVKDFLSGDTGFAFSITAEDQRLCINIISADINAALVAILLLDGFPPVSRPRRIQPFHVTRGCRALLAEKPVRLLDETPGVVVPARAALSHVRLRGLHLSHARVHLGAEVGVTLGGLRRGLEIGGESAKRSVEGQIRTWERRAV